MRRIEVELATGALKLQSMPLQRQEVELLRAQDEPRLEAMRRKLAALKARSAQLGTISSRTRLDALRARRAQAELPADQALLDLQILAERVVLHYLQDPDKTRELDQTYTQERADRLRRRIEWSGAAWNRIVESLEFRGGQEASRLYVQIREELHDRTRPLRELREKLGSILAESQDLNRIRERTLERINALADKATTTARATDATQRTRIQTDIAGERGRLDEALRTATQRLDTIATRLGETIELLETHMARLTDIQRRIHWRRITTRDPGLLGVDFHVAWSELATLAAPARADDLARSEPNALAALRGELLDDGTDVRADANALRTAWARCLHTATGGDWGWSIAALLGLTTLGYGLHRIGRKKGVRLAEHIVERFGHPMAGLATAGTGVSARIDLLGWNMLGDLAIPLLVGTAIALSTGWLIGEPTVQSMILTVLACLAGAALLLRLVHHVFEASSPPHRPIPCGDAVAHHYRWWMSGLVFWTLLVLTAPIMLHLIHIAPALERAMVEIYKVGFLVALVLFLLRKDRTLGQAGASGVHWGLTAVMIGYPVLVLGVIAALVLELAGFSELVGYVGRGLLLTAAAVVVIGTITAYIADVVEARLSGMSKTDTSVVMLTASGGTCADEPLPAPDPPRPQYIAALLSWIVRLLGLLGVVLLTLEVWNVPVQSGWVNWRLIGLSVLVVLVALLLDRITFTAMRTLQGSGRLPESTANISRRWIRGLLFVLATLSIVAIAGFEVGSIWQFVTALLAMVAIGFVAVWSMLSNILATLVILVWRPFDVGERIELLPEGVGGQVVDINFIFTTLKADDGARVAIPNNFFAQKFIRRQRVHVTPERSLAEQLEADQPLDEQQPQSS